MAAIVCRRKILRLYKMNETRYKNKYRIESTRLKGWDYGGNGYYFITICVKNRDCALGRVENGAMILSDIGEMAAQCWREIPSHFPFAGLDEFVVMPNHVHGIVVIDKPLPVNVQTHVETQNVASLRNERNRVVVVETQDFASLQNRFGSQSQNLASIIRGFKIGVKKWATINDIPFQWQSRFHDHIIRNEIELHKIREYIVSNPLNWETDENYI
ncbi:MAG: hypothetical protein HZA20_05170 [Nitrospirae bacterium]|nr:hypothetical protein [Nitrospirota bacterium]